jgi:hypothetical protein
MVSTWIPSTAMINCSEAHLVLVTWFPVTSLSSPSTNEQAKTEKAEILALMGTHARSVRIPHSVHEHDH